MKFLIILLAVVGLAIYDYLHDKTIIKKPGAWVKYIVAASCGLLYTIITSWSFFLSLSIAGVVVLGGIFWGVLSNWAVNLYYSVTKKPKPVPPTTTKAP